MYVSLCVYVCVCVSTVAGPHHLGLCERADGGRHAAIVADLEQRAVASTVTATGPPRDHQLTRIVGLQRIRGIARILRKEGRNSVRGRERTWWSMPNTVMGRWTSDAT